MYSCSVYSAVLILKRYPNSRGIIGPCYFFFSITAAILLLTVPFRLSGVLLFATWLTTVAVPAFVLALSWCASSSAGHTKKTTVNAMLLIGYCTFCSIAISHLLAHARCGKLGVTSNLAVKVRSEILCAMGNYPRYICHVSYLPVSGIYL